MTKELGNLGEKLAVGKLSQMGYRIITRNYSCSFGEIDLIAKDKDMLVFIEVRSRKNNQYGFPFETVNLNKQKKIRKVAQHYLLSQNLVDSFCRFDVVSIIWGVEKEPVIEVIKDAF